ncbi:unnamed protein product [Candidula unifasciata]|uniref:Globin n=1 Tax=Candidula unifasciata TaxID=100452 RepID=A0A8S4A3F8_9EUPU|nr:unnamed protein product [Candidula unifasciata]
MGCLNTKAGNVKPKAAPDSNGKIDPNCNGQFSNIAQPHNEALGLSQRQVFSMKQSWKGIKRRMEETGVEMFVRLFHVDETLQTMFHKFKDIRNDEELRSNEALEYHATLVMTTLDDAIVHIDNFEYVQQLLHRVGASHVKFQGFRPETFYKMREPFLEAVKVTLGDRYTENIQSVYIVAISFILNTMVEGLSQAIGGTGSGSGSDVMLQS